MTDGSGRSAEEREAARREREMRRTGIFHQPGEIAGSGEMQWSDGSSEEPDATDATDGTDGTDDTAAAAVAAPRDDFDPGQADPAPADPGPEERPSGTRRVSRVPPDSRGRRAAPAGRLGDRPRRAPAPGVRSRAEGRVGARARPAGRGGGSRRGLPSASAPGLRWVVRVASLLVVVIAAVAIWFAIDLFQPFGTSPHGRVTVVVPPHTGAQQIGDLLARDGVIPSGFFFNARAVLDGDRGKLRSGTYQLQKGMSYGAVLTRLMAVPKAAPTTELTIAEGHTRQYVAKLLRKQGIRGNYLGETRRSALLNPVAYGAPADTPSLEGFLFPDTFQLLDPVKVSTLVDDQLRDFKQRFAGVNLSYAASKHLTGYDVLKIASLIEAEAASAHDRPLVASVIYNRLRDGMMLQFDSTARYATGNFTGPLTVSQLNSPSPYNTHTHFGLPPTPINSPGLAAIQAAAHPAQSNYLYFFTKPCNEGGSVFTSTYSQFLYLLAADKRTHC